MHTAEQPMPAETHPTKPPPSASATPSPARSVTIAFGGDVHFEGAVAGRLAENPATTLGPVTALLSAADVAMVNLETAVTDGGTAAAKKYTFRAPRTAFRALTEAGVDVATMANNHGLDYGREGLTDSLNAAAEYDFPVVGIGRNAQKAYAPHVVTVAERRIGFIGATQVLDSHLVSAWTATETQPGLASAKNVDRLLQAVQRTRKQVDALVVYLHWGQSMEPCPLERQRSLARKLADAGADVIVGTHAHRLLAGGFLDDAYVHYGMGNFVWYSASGETAQTGVLTVTLTGGEVSKAKWSPAAISGGVPHPLTGSARQIALTQWKALRQCTSLAPTPRSG